MKRAAVAVGGLIARIASSVGLEGAFFLVGGTCLAIGASYVAPFGPWIVAGALCILASIGLAIPERRQ